MKTKISSDLLNLIRKNDSFLIVGHVNPEGDSIGSSLAFALGLKKFGKKYVHVVSKDPVPENLNFLPSSRMIQHKIPKKKYDVAILIDCNHIERTGFKELNAGRTAVIDHHVLPENAGSSDFYTSLSASFIDPDAAAAGLLVYKVLSALKITFDRNMATNLYTALLVDTGGFRYSNATPEALKVASEMVESGAAPWDISKELYENNPYGAMKLQGLSLSTLEKKDGIAWITVTRAMFRKTGTGAEDCEEFVDLPRKIKDIEVAIFFRQDGNRSYKVSFRSKGKANVQKIARIFGGGGHVAAAGCMVKGNLKEVQTKVFRAVRKALKENKK
ncbi:MAG: bifunctional oligoribonuclease/PAP phosphatase NrnA [Nitrospiraceae bacterium]|nr:MAG: bifunctional oligoribonuclease/PAP phosphatase NrnA [Nitrospiraceae bacterium]